MFFLAVKEPKHDDEQPKPKKKFLEQPEIVGCVMTPDHVSFQCKFGSDLKTLEREEVKKLWPYSVLDYYEKNMTINPKIVLEQSAM